MNMNGPSRARPGCFGYGCAIAVVLMVVMLGGAGYYIVTSIRSAVMVYTVERPQKLQVPQVESTLAVSARTKLDGVATAVRNKTATAQEIAGAELEAFIQTTSWRDLAVVSLDNNRVMIDFSFPLSALGEWSSARFLLGKLMERGVYGSAEGSFAVTKGVFKVSFSKLILNGKVLEEMARGHASDWVSGALNSWGSEAREEERTSLAAPNVNIEIREGKAILSVGVTAAP